MAVSAINHFHAKTGSKYLCPIRLIDDESRYISPHDEAAFIEYEKVQHGSEMPIIYHMRIIEAWERYFNFGDDVDMSSIYVPALEERKFL